MLRQLMSLKRHARVERCGKDRKFIFESSLEIFASRRQHQRKREVFIIMRSFDFQYPSNASI